tara:strand:+ start:1300 stop:1512 length:213 start_codon:yes stop_codon:yes gene_type:complete
MSDKKVVIEAFNKSLGLSGALSVLPIFTFSDVLTPIGKAINHINHHTTTKTNIAVKIFTGFPLIIFLQVQ